MSRALRLSGRRAHALELTWAMHPGVASRLPWLWHRVLTYALGTGLFWVMGFFVISGYCIHLSVQHLIDRGSFPLKTYLLARLTRILPLYYLALFFAIIVEWGIASDRPPCWLNGLNGGVIACQLLMIQNFTQTFGSFAPSWSITNEFFYYIFYGLIAFALARRTRRPATVGMAMCLLAGISMQLIYRAGYKWSPVLAVGLLFGLGINWFLGAMIAERSDSLVHDHMIQALARFWPAMVVASITMWCSQHVHLEYVYLSSGFAFTFMLVRFLGQDVEHPERADGATARRTTLGDVVGAFQLSHLPVPRADPDDRRLGELALESRVRLEMVLGRLDVDRTGVRSGASLSRGATNSGVAGRVAQTPEIVACFDQSKDRTRYDLRGSAIDRRSREGPSMTFAICFTNFGPYHLARLRGLATRLAERGDRLLAYEVAGCERTYPWTRSRHDEPFEWVTLFPDRVLETIETDSCRGAMIEALEHDQPDAIGIVGYVRPESMAAVRWASRRRCPTILMSESQEIDRPRVWWKELVKRRRVRWFDAAVVGGPTHRDYLVSLGMPRNRISLGYNAVDNDYFASSARRWRENLHGRNGLPQGVYFLTVCRFVPEKNLVRLIAAFARYRRETGSQPVWDLVLCGDGPGSGDVEAAVSSSGFAHAIHRPGFLQIGDLPRWYAHAGAFVLPSLMEPWGLVVNEAAACGLPLLVSCRAGCSATLVPEPEGTTGARFDPYDIEEMAARLSWIATRSADVLEAMGRHAAETVSHWGPARFAQGVVEAIDLAFQGRRRPTPLSFSVSETR